ncbi:DUF4157 domain-containing protein [Streptomyces sp. NPDC087538]|uniref:eCIS core domain-containing protein n=1 Tax=Streptomyces sp. NPDC087538 TaxID=3365797 RepID=UPI0037F2116C
MHMDRDSSGMTHAHRHNTPRRPEKSAGTPVTTTARTTPGTRTEAPPTGLVALQAGPGNAMVVQMLRAAGHPWAQEPPPYTAEDAHRRAEQPQRSGTPGSPARPAVQRSAVHDVLRTSGRALDEETRTDMEARLGADFSDVRIHTDAAARASAAEVGAHAYTSGNHIVIGSGGGDRHTLAHELTHVIQQRRGAVAGTDRGDGLKVSDPSDRFEREAEASATHAMGLGTTPAAPVRRTAGRSAPRTATTAGPAAVQRKATLAALNASASTGAFGQGQVEEGGVGTVALVPAVLSDDLDLFAIADTYTTGFDEDTSPVDRFALVIGVNCWRAPGTDPETLLRNRISNFTSRWDDTRFRVEIIGFTWSDHRVTSTAGINQATIPYGEIRDRIQRDPKVAELVEGLKNRGREHVYLHIGDSDTQSFATAAGPLFSAASTALGTGETDLFSGGYTAPESTRATADGILIWHAGQVDLAVRDAMAGMDPSAVYYPEPNTFVKVKTDWGMHGLEDGISFGTGKLEGKQLVESLRSKRSDVTAAFDSRYAITTDMSRVGENVGGHERGAAVTDATLKKLFDLAQSHARKQEWQDRVAAAYGLGPRQKLALADLVYGKVTDVGVLRQLAAMNLGADDSKYASGLKKKIKENAELKGLGDQVVDMAVRSRITLLHAMTQAWRSLTERSTDRTGS